jgi:hypothetical protein
MGMETQRPGEVARRLLRAADRAALATSLAGGEEAAAGGWPYASLVLLACGHDAAPLLLISDLAEHSKNIADDPRVGLLIDGTAGRVDPLTGPRVTILGTAEKTDDAGSRHALSRVIPQPRSMPIFPISTSIASPSPARISWPGSAGSTGSRRQNSSAMPRQPRLPKRKADSSRR